jgi:hypothetical protein
MSSTVIPNNQPPEQIKHNTMHSNACLAVSIHTYTSHYIYMGRIIIAIANLEPFVLRIILTTGLQK